MTLQLEIGRTYKSREGDKVKIVGMRAATIYRYESERGSWYADDGCFDLDQPEHGFDLVEECEPGEVAREATKPVPLCEAILEEIEKEWEAAPDDYYAAAMTTSKAIIRNHFAALSVDAVKAVLLANDGGVDEAAQGVINLLRKEPA